MDTARRVRRLHLRGPDEAAIRRGAVLVEDAVRTASLPLPSGRVVVVRRLKLGSIQPGMTPAQISRLVESALERPQLVWYHGLDARAVDGDIVWFEDAAEAHAALARRLLDGRSADEWFWRLAVPAWRGSREPAEVLRELRESLAELPEAERALASFEAALGAGGEGTASPPAGPDEVAPRPVASRSRSRDIPTQPQSALESSDSPSDSPAHAERRPPRGSPAPRPAPALADEGSARFTSHRGPAPAAASMSHGGALQARTGDAAASSPDATPLPGTAPADATSAAHDLSHRGHVPAALHQAGGELTSAGGLLFLLNALAAMGYSCWIADHPQWAGARIGQRVLLEVLNGLRMTDEDPIRQLLEGAANEDPTPHTFAAPPRWSPGLWRGRGACVDRRDGSLEMKLDPGGRLLLAARTDDIDVTRASLEHRVVEAWAVASRRWLRRNAHIGFASLVRRPALLTITSTHVDLFFDLERADLRVRRAGLDLDPGWVAWLGRVVSFHYLRGGAL